MLRNNNSFLLTLDFRNKKWFQRLTAYSYIVAQKMIKLILETKQYLKNKI